MRRKTKASNERLQPALSRAPGPGPFLLTSVKDPRQNPPRPHPFLLTSFKYPPSTTPRPLAPYSSADPALPDSPLIGPPSPRIRNSQQMWASRLFSGMWSICTGIRSLVTRPAPLRHPDSCTSHYCSVLSMEVHRSPRPNRVPESSRDGRVRKGPPVRGKETTRKSSRGI